jgi:hypothetical protein
VLPLSESRAPGFTADDSGVGQWLTDHPTVDGRGVTIALLENALPSFADAVVRSAKTLDGRSVSKIAGILPVADDSVTDETRVPLDTVVHATKAWTRIGSRTYILPSAASYRFGTYELPAGTNVVQRFAVVEDLKTHDVWIDTNGDASFQDETPLADVNQRFDPRYLRLTHPTKGRVAFVMGFGRKPHVVHIYLARGSHQTMTLSVAAGSRTDDSLAFGVAPNARVLLVRVASPDPSLATIFEGFIEAAQRPDVDVISSSLGLMPVPDTEADFSGVFARRLEHVYRKPIFNSAGNRSPLVGSADGSMLSVGGVLSPATWSSLYGGRRIDALIVHPISAAGPSIDGAIKPDFLAPMERIAADLPWSANLAAVPQNAPTHRLPRGYQISCCTSAASPYAAGIAALLISAAKQSGIVFGAARLNDALRFSAKLVPGAPAHRQGHGLLDVGTAWQALRQPIERPRITASARIVHPLAQYAERGEQGVGILEVAGWTPGMTATRTIVFTRASGPATPLTYRLVWSASDGSFSTPSSITLPLRQPVAVPVRITVRTAGTHSGLLELRDDKTGTPVFRTQATVVAAERVDPKTQLVRATAVVGHLSHRSHYVRVPDGTTAITFELEVIRGVVNPTIVPSHGLFPSYYMHVYPMNVFYAGKGKHVVRIPNPAPGIWTLQIQNDSTAGNTLPASPVRADDSDAAYTVTVRLQDVISTPAEAALEVTDGYLVSHNGRFLANGLPNLFHIDVPRDASMLSLRLRTEAGGPKAELYLYDCTTGECFSYNIGFPAAHAHTLAVRKPNAGRWVAAVNAAPFPAASGSFVLEDLVTLVTPTPMPHRTPVRVTELIDAAGERAEISHPWSTAPNYVKLRDRPIALRTTIQPR